MKNWIINVSISTLLLLLLVAPTLALNLDGILGTVLPFANEKTRNYYIEAQIAQDALEQYGYDSLEYQIYQMDNKTVGITTLPLHDGTLHEFQFKFGTDTSITFKPDLNLFFANYELQIVGVEEVANRDVFIINIISKHTNKKTNTYIIDQETNLILGQYQYDSLDNISYSFIVTEVDYNPDFSAVFFDESPVIDQRELLQEIPKKQFSQHLPWLKIDNLSLPQGFEIIGYAQVELGHNVLEEKYLTKGEPDIPVTSLYIILSDGLRELIIHVAYLDDHKSTTEYSIEITDSSPETYVMISVPEADTVLSTKTSILTREEILTLLKEFVPQK